MITALTINEQNELREHEQTIEQGLKTFVDVGNALLAIREEQLYRVEYGTFDAYCQERWGFVSRQAERLILASRTVQNLRPIGRKLPTSEYQARPLTQLEPEQQREVWTAVVQESQETGERITGAKVKAMVARAILGDEDYEPEEWEDAEICGWLAAYNAQGLDVCRYSGNEVIGTECGPHCQYYVIDAPGIDDEPLLPKSPHVSQNTGNNEWYTPPKYIEAARQTMGGIDCDPATSELANQTIQAETYYTIETDGLSSPWRGRVWMNPPYAQSLIKQFCKALSSKYSSGEISEACVLVNNASETGWFDTLAEHASCRCDVKSRIHFIDTNGKPSGSPLQGQVVLYFGPNDTKFAQAFSALGRIWHAW